VKDSADWFEQAALMHLTKHYPEVAAHYQFVPQRAINSYPKECTNCNTGPYEVGGDSFATTITHMYVCMYI
jgi:hypothetical protein